LILTVGGIVFFTLLLVTGNTMSNAVRERMTELAVLKAIGCSDRLLLFLILGESLVVAMVGSGLGLGIAMVCTLGSDPTGGLLGLFYLPNSSILVGLGLAAAVGIVGGLFPAIKAMRLRVANGLRAI